MNVCRSCHAPIIWALTGSAKSIPLDAQPNPAGNVELADGIAKAWGTSHVWPEGTQRYMPHHATCPDGEEWKRSV